MSVGDDIGVLGLLLVGAVQVLLRPDKAARLLLKGEGWHDDELRQLGLLPTNAEERER